MKGDLMNHFDKLLLAALFVLMVGLDIYAMAHANSAISVQWAENLTGQVLAALLALMTSRGFQRGSDKPTGGQDGTQNASQPAVIGGNGNSGVQGK